MLFSHLSQIKNSQLTLGITSNHPRCKPNYLFSSAKLEFPHWFWGSVRQLRECFPRFSIKKPLTGLSSSSLFSPSISIFPLWMLWGDLRQHCRALPLCNACFCCLSLLSYALVTLLRIWECLLSTSNNLKIDKRTLFLFIIVMHNHIFLFYHKKAVRPQSYCFFCQIFVYAIAAFIIIAHSNRFFSKSHESLCDFKILPSYCQLLAAQPPLQ